MYSKKRIPLLVIAAMLLCTVASHADESGSAANAFQLFQKKYHKVYLSAEEATYRQQIFSDNLAKIQKHNAENHSYQLGINQYADQTLEEFSQSQLLTSGWQHQFSAQSSNRITPISNHITLPATVDWRTQGAVTQVKNQGGCGSSWAFATTGLMEGAGFIQTGRLYNLSEQEFLDCDSNDAACAGGEISNALSFAMNGITTEASYPYTARQGLCRATSRHVLDVSGYTPVTANDALALTAAVAQQPIAVGVEADSTVFQFYKSGIITSQHCGTILNHALLIVGYGTENGIPYWICKNSWGTSWGETGYVRIARQLTSDSGPGICGIASYPWAVNVVV